jgi:hypothetical protein
MIDGEEVASKIGEVLALLEGFHHFVVQLLQDRFSW